MVNTEKCQVPLEKLDPKIVKWLRRTSRGWGFDDLQNEMRKYPKENLSTVETEVQVQASPQHYSLPAEPPISSLKVPVAAETSELQNSKVPVLSSVAESPGAVIVFPPALNSAENDCKIDSWFQGLDYPAIPLPSESFSQNDLLALQADLTPELENVWESFEDIPEEDDVQFLVFRSQKTFAREQCCKTNWEISLISERCP